MLRENYKEGITDDHVYNELLEREQDKKCAQCFNYDVCDIKDTPERMVCSKE